MHERRTSLTTKALVVASVVAILGLTLGPSAADSEKTIGFWCFFCASGGVADGLLNILLFMPLGAGLGLLGGAWTSLLGSLGLSGLIELFQTGLPGRFPSAEDLLLNTLGGMAGWAAALRWPRILRAAVAPSARTRALALLLPPSVYLATILLSAPWYPSSYSWFGQWTHELGTMESYPGRVLEASVGGHPLPDGLVPNQSQVQAAVGRGDPLRVTFVTGPPPPSLAHLFAIYDEKPREVLLLGVQGSDLLFQRRTLSVHLRFDEPFMVWKGALGGPEGAEKTVEIGRRGTSVCMTLNDTVRCDLAAGLEGGWRLLHRFGGAPTLLVGFLGWVWLAILAVPTGLVYGMGTRTTTPAAYPWVPGWAASAASGLALGITGSLVSWVVPWLSFHTVQLLAPMAGALAGSVLGRFSRHWAHAVGRTTVGVQDP